MNSHYTKLINNNCVKCFAPINSNNCCQTISMRKQIEALKVQLEKLETQTSPGKIATLEKSIFLIETTLSNFSNRNDDNILNLENCISTIEVNLLKKEEETRTTKLAFEKTRIDNLLTSFNIDEAKLTNVINSYSAADTDIMDRINGLTTSLSTLSTDLMHLKNVVQTALTLAPST